MTDRYRWTILGVLWITYLVVFLHRLSVGPLGPFFKEDLHISSTQVGLVMSAAAFGYMVTLFPAGWVTDRIGGRRLIVAGEMVAGASLIALFFVPSYVWLLVLMFVTGMGCGFLLPSTTRGVIVWFPLKERATVMGFKQTAVNIGGIITATTLPVVALALGWRYGFLILGVVAIIIGIIAFILYKEPPRQVSSVATGSADPAMPILEILKNREIWMVALCHSCLVWIEMAVITHLVLYLTEELLFPVVTAGGLLAMVEAAGAIGRPGGGLLSDRVFGGSRKPILILMAGTTAVVCLVVSLFGSQLSWAIYPVLFLLGLAGTGFGGVILTLVSEFGGKRGAGRAAGLSTTVVMGGNILGPAVFGYIVDMSHSYQWAWLSLAFVATLCILLLLLVKEEKRKI